MNYENIVKGTFLSRPNRFIAQVNIKGKVETVHVKNTGRCKELLIKGATVFCNKVNSKTRKTKYDLISVYKGENLINIDSSAPNKVFLEYIKKGKFKNNLNVINPEYTYENSRLDFYLETSEKEKILIETKGVTLEKENIALFPDAPTERGVKHIKDLIYATKKGYTCYIVFIIQMKNINCFMPNTKMHKEFTKELVKAKRNGVNILAYDTIVTDTAINIDNKIKVKLNENYTENGEK